MTDSPPPGSRLSTRLQADAERQVAERTLQLFLDEGFAATTVAHAARTAGVSERTFHRYFRTKDQVVDAALVAGSRAFMDAFADRDPGEPLLESIAAALGHGLDQDVWGRRFLVAMADEPALAWGWVRVHHTSQEDLRPLLAARLGLDPAGPRAQFLAATVVAACRISVERWAIEGADWRTILTDLLDPVLRTVR